MKIVKVILCLIIMSSMLNGCLKKKRSSGSYIGTDTPLEAFPLDSFSEVFGMDTQILKDIYFDYNQYNIRHEGKDALDNIAMWLKDRPKTHLLIEGHCDERGSNEYNMALGEQRALSVRQYLVNNGIKAGRIQTISYGEEKPAVYGHDESAWSKNRRAHFLTAEE